MGYIDISATYLDMVKSVSTPYLVRIKVPLCGAGTEETRRRHGPGTVQTLSGTREKEIDSANEYRKYIDK